MNDYVASCLLEWVEDWPVFANQFDILSFLDMVLFQHVALPQVAK